MLTLHIYGILRLIVTIFCSITTHTPAPTLANWTGTIMDKWNEGPVTFLKVLRDFDKKEVVFHKGYIFSHAADKLKLA